ncbi:hydroxyethylthiazole kinase [Psychrobacillus insolitus]|uniref:Hydroxyethylthiazole kinase n=1 Tax=Psychrobacillus insolitus TaxID=1461 RepID=A0A2W7MJT6_9BACI|nr:hydroxyethylthiazole kinase [Psychrobacillus insolitus]PZX07417.1 hydroxyethylthiazole kinase [Psychrobacillus insolitus]
MSISDIRLKSPLVHCITNYVVANFTANGLLAIGASPVMADEASEVEEMVSIANALLINLGTVNTRTKESMFLAGKKANALNIPVVLDPVGVGATTFRLQLTRDILEVVDISLIRCNIGELAAIAGVDWQAKGVDGGSGQMNLETVAVDVAKKHNCLVIVTGKSDLLTDGNKIIRITGGHKRMTEVTGTGCLLSAICSAALAFSGERFENLQKVLQDYKKVATKASKSTLLGSFQVDVLNALDEISRGELK